jgi:aspartate 1-decarboxylase
MVLTRVLKCKIHRATITDADVEYEGSITVDEDLMEEAGLHDFEEVHVWNVTRGSRLTTYVIPGERGSGTICLNGAAALLNAAGDLVIIAAFVDVDEAELASHEPTLLFVDGDNRVKSSQGPMPRRSAPSGGDGRR